jgi:hypothetical protein
LGQRYVTTCAERLKAESRFQVHVDQSDQFIFVVRLAGMTEKGSKYRHVFFRQGILGPGKVPVIMSMGRFDVVKQFGEEIDADFVAVGEMNDAEKGIPVGTNQNEINKMPWAIQ